MVLPPVSNVSTSVASVVPTLATVVQDPAEMLHACGHVFFAGLVQQFGWMFYLISPNSSIFESVNDVPNYEVQVCVCVCVSVQSFVYIVFLNIFPTQIFPIFGLFMLIEQAIRFIQHKRFSRISDIVINVGAGLIFVAVRVMLLSVIVPLFYWLYDNYRLVTLPNCLSTWIISLLLVEFVYYWVHRSLHEINIFWASHQFHHNAVEIDVSTTLRDTVVDLIIYEVNHTRWESTTSFSHTLSNFFSFLTILFPFRFSSSQHLWPCWFRRQFCWCTCNFR